jgi:hypothetical protein
MPKDEPSPRPLWGRRRRTIRLADEIDAYLEPMRQAGRDWRALDEIRNALRERETYGDPDTDEGKITPS